MLPTLSEYRRPSSLVRLLGREIDVDLNAGIFVTLNPAGKKYGGRSKLPDNLKALFRPVAMGRPDNELIAEVSREWRQAGFPLGGLRVRLPAPPNARQRPIRDVPSPETKFPYFVSIRFPNLTVRR